MSRKLMPPNALGKLLVLILAVAFLEPLAWSQHLSRLEREQAQDMLETVTSDVRRTYYDPQLHGIDWDTKVREAKAAIDRATSFDEVYTQIAAVLEMLNDSHTFFIPPRRTVLFDYGWRFQMVGDRCYVIQVRPGSDAEAKGLKPGDQVLTIDGFAPTREDWWKMTYAMSVLSPQRGLEVVFREPSSRILKADLKASLRQTKYVLDFYGQDFGLLQLQNEEQRHVLKALCEDMGPDLVIIKIPAFTQSKLEIKGLLNEARKHRTLIVDLRGTPGGVEESLQNWVGGIFDRDVKIADRVGRGKTTTVMAKSSRHDAYMGKILVLVDSSSGSAAELFARVVQIEKRGTVLGDHTSGATMEGTLCWHQRGTSLVYTYGTLVTRAELLMADGRSLEHVGVTPEETILPAGADLADARDPVLTRAAEIAGVKIAPEKAGSLFPRKWAKDSPFAF